MLLDDFRTMVVRDGRRGSFSQEPQRDEILDVAGPFWRFATPSERDELRRELAAIGFDDASLIEALVAYASTVIHDMSQRPYRPSGPPPAPPTTVSLDDPLRVALAKVPEGKQISRGEIAKVMRRYMADRSPMTRARIKVLLREAGYTGEGALANFAAHELDKRGRLKPREPNWGILHRERPGGIWQ